MAVPTERVFEAQDQALRTNFIKTKIDKSQDNPTCRMCKKVDESVIRISFVDAVN